MMETIEAHSNPKGEPHWQRRLDTDPRIFKPCEGCGHRGYMHKDAEQQYKKGHYQVMVFEVGDITCEAEGCGCEWYEGDNWK